MEKLRKAEALLERAEGALLTALLSVMVVLSFLQVFLRQFFSASLLWGDTLTRHLVLWVGFLGAALAAAEGKHFAWEAASHGSGAFAKVSRLIAELAAAAITALLLSASWTFLNDERAAGDVLFTAGHVAVPAWLFSTIIPAGFLLVLIHTLVRAAGAATAEHKP